MLTGLSGSGKSSLAFDTIYAEGQRRYMESLSSYARQFLARWRSQTWRASRACPGDLHRPEVHEPEPEVHGGDGDGDLRLLPPPLRQGGHPPLPELRREIRRQTVDEMVDQIMALPERTKIQLLAPVVRGRKGTHAKLFERAKRSGYVRVRVDGSMYEAVGGNRPG